MSARIDTADLIESLNAEVSDLKGHLATAMDVINAQADQIDAQDNKIDLLRTACHLCGQAIAQPFKDNTAEWGALMARINP